jgi:ADP-ribose pyrophosphatase YjhB (NUDIX family)
MKANKRVAIAYIKDKQDRLLMGKRNDCSKWTTPGGHANKGEDIHEAMARELKEETGLDAQWMKIIGVSVNPKNGKLIYLFEVIVDSNQKIDVSNDPDKECDDWVYIDPLEVAKELHVPIEHNVALKHWSK